MISCFRAPPSTEPPPSPFWTFWTQTSSRAAGGTSSSRASAPSASASPATMRRGTREEVRRSGRSGWRPAKAATERRNTRAVSPNSGNKQTTLTVRAYFYLFRFLTTFFSIQRKNKTFFFKLTNLQLCFILV